MKCACVNQLRKRILSLLKDFITQPQADKLNAHRR